MARPAPTYPAEVIAWYRNALNRDPDIDGLAFWSKMFREAGAEAAWAAFCYSASVLGTVIAMSRDEASNPVVGGNYSVVDEWFKAFNVTGDWLKYELMVSNGQPIPDVFKKFCADYGIKGFDWLEASKLT